MRTKSSNFITSIFAVFLSCVVYFFWMPYPKSFFKTMGNATFGFDLITNCIYFVLYFVLIANVVSSIAMPGHRITGLDLFALVGICILLQVSCDIVKVVIGGLLGVFSIIVDDIFVVLQTVFIFFIVIKKLHIKQINYRKLFSIYFMISFVFLIVCIYSDVLFLREIAYVTDKYFKAPTDMLSALNVLASSSTMATTSKNLQYWHELYCLGLDFLCQLAMILGLYFSTRDNRSSFVEDKRVAIPKLLIRLFVILLVFSFGCGVKYFVLPQNFLINTKMNNSSSYSAEICFNYDRKFTSVFRAVNYKDRNEIFCKTKGRVYYGDEKLLDIHMDYDYSDKPIEKLLIDDTEVNIICKNQAIAYLKNEKPFIILFKDIRNEENDAILLETCKNLLEDGRTDCFEHIVEYVQKYDSKFIQPYIERYAKGDFSRTEIVNMGEISPEFLSKCAKRIVE